MTDTHEIWCQYKLNNHEGYADAAKRIRDEYLLHRVAGGFDVMGKWIACNLQDGTSDHVLYDSKRDAVLHQHGYSENYYTYIKLVAPTMNACEAYVMLRIARVAYNNGMRLADSDHKTGGMSIIHRVSIEDQLAVARGMPTNLRFPDPSQHRRKRR